MPKQNVITNLKIAEKVPFFTGLYFAQLIGAHIRILTQPVGFRANGGQGRQVIDLLHVFFISG